MDCWKDDMAVAVSEFSVSLSGLGERRLLEERQLDTAFDILVLGRGFGGWN